MYKFKYLLSIISISFFIFMMSQSPVLAQSKGAVGGPKSIRINKVSHKNLIKYRAMVMNIKGMHTQAIRFLIKKRMLSRPQIIAHAEALHIMTDDMLRLFTIKSVDKKSRSKANIWNAEGRVSSEFVELTKKMGDEAIKLIEIVKYKNYRQIRSQLKTFEKNGCKDCHSKFRGKGTPDAIEPYKVD